MPAEEINLPASFFQAKHATYAFLDTSWVCDEEDIAGLLL